MRNFQFSTKKLFDVKPEKYFYGTLSIYRLNAIPAEYSEMPVIGKDFDYRYWPMEDYSRFLPFFPEVFKKNGHIKFEQGKVFDYFLENKKTMNK